MIVAAGESTRLAASADGVSRRKPWLELDDRAVLEHTLSAFDAAESVEEVILVVHADDVESAERMCAERPAYAKVRAVVPGGAERAHSVRLGVFWCSFEMEVIAVHDAARPLIEPEQIESAVHLAAVKGSALVAAPVQDTIKVSPDGLHAESTLDRSVLWCAQTPQAFAARRFREVMQRGADDNVHATDEASLWERYVGPVAIVAGDARNLKITTPADLAIARAILHSRAIVEAEKESRR